MLACVHSLGSCKACLGRALASQMAGSLALVSFLIALACSSAQITEPQPTALDLSIYQQQTALQLPAGTARGGLDLTPAPREVVGSQACLGVPVSSYVTWTCLPGALQCSGTCISGTQAPYGPPVAVCTGGKWVISRTCMAGKIAASPTLCIIQWTTYIAM